MSNVSAQRERLLDLLADRALVGLDAVESEELGRLLVDFPDVETLARDIEMSAAAVALASFAKHQMLDLPEGLLGKIEADAQDGLPTTIHKLADLAAMAEEAMRSPDGSAIKAPTPAAGAKADALKHTLQIHQMPTLPTPITPQPIHSKPTPAAGTSATATPASTPSASAASAGQPPPPQQQQPPNTVTQTAPNRPFPQSQPGFPASGPATQAMPPQQPPQQQQPQQQPSIQPPSLPALHEQHSQPLPQLPQQFQQPQQPQQQQQQQPPPGQVLPFHQMMPPERVVAPRPQRGGRGWAVTGWLAAAACLALAAGTWWFRPRQEIVWMTPPPPPPQPPPSSTPLPPTPAQERDALIAKAGTARVEWTKTKDATSKAATGDVVWNATEQKGFMRFRGLAKNDRRSFVYQLWIFDKGREEKFPVDGGVFDVDDETGDVIVPIKARLPVGEAALFAVTVEKPGGVVVSKRERIVVTAKPAT